MKEKQIHIRADEEFLQKLEYLMRIYGFKSLSDTIRRIIEKEYRKETGHTDNFSKSVGCCKECEHRLPPLTGVIDGEVKELTSMRCPLMSSGFTQSNGWCYHFRQNGKSLFTNEEGYLLN